MNTYSAYKPSGVEWLGDIPKHWTIRRLKYLGNARPSNVDKKTVDGESEVLLCNYMDVHKNDFITSSLDFMAASATSPQIEKFVLEAGDVLATKDSESPDDIGVPALVVEDFDNVICGYHLTHIKPFGIKGSFLFRYLQSNFVSAVFEASADGITRYALGVADFNDLPVVEPSAEEQTTIAAYLDDKTAKLDELISNKEAQIERLKELRQIEITHAVTKGLNPKVPLKASGVEWLGDIPEHWEVKRLRKIVDRFVDYRGKTPEKTVDGVVLVTARNIKNGNITFEKSMEYIDESDYDSWMVRGFPKRGDLLFTTEAPLGEVALVEDEYIALAQRIILFKTKPKVSYPKFLKYFFQSNCGQDEILRLATGSTALGIKGSKLPNVNTITPPLSEQLAISEYLDNRSSKIDQLIQNITTQIEQLKEVRKIEIYNAVTGKVKVA